jgi:hypothetical protein
MLNAGLLMLSKASVNALIWVISRVIRNCRASLVPASSVWDEREEIAEPVRKRRPLPVRGRLLYVHASTLLHRSVLELEARPHYQASVISHINSNLREAIMSSV